MNDLSHIDPAVGVPVTILLWLALLVQRRRELVANRRRLRSLARCDHAVVLDLSMCTEDCAPDDEVKREQCERNGEESYEEFSHVRSVSPGGGSRG